MVEVILKDCIGHPSCSHGPCLMFERRTANGQKSGRRFYACSACRDRSICSFFHWADDKFPDTKRELWNKVIESAKPVFNHKQCIKRLKSFAELPPHSRKYCHTCSSIILEGEKSHGGHDVVQGITSEQLLRPSSIFHTYENKKKEAQYFFSPKTVHFLVSTLKTLQFSKVILIGVPKIHEYLLVNQDSEIKSFLLDIDHRYMQFFSKKQFSHYNMFNNHFFGGEDSKAEFLEFLKEKTGEKIAILLDPPFGGLIDAISFNLLKINDLWQTLNNKESSEIVPLLWFFPYFLETRVNESIPGLVMSDYKVEYSNHEKFGKKAGNKGSPIRVFTNIPGSSFALPEEEGYKYCKICERWVSKENEHCSKCGRCTTKHGPTYRHCSDCQQCVKSHYLHCDLHNRCFSSSQNSGVASNERCRCKSSSDEGSSNRCYKCSAYGHRKRDCPVGGGNPKKRRKQMKKNTFVR